MSSAHSWMVFEFALVAAIGARPTLAQQPAAAPRDPALIFATTCGWCHHKGGREAGKGPQLMGTTLSDAQIVIASSGDGRASCRASRARFRRRKSRGWSATYAASRRNSRAYMDDASAHDTGMKAPGAADERQVCWHGISSTVRALGASRIMASCYGQVGPATTPSSRVGRCFTNSSGFAEL
jgi:hypothetical protein